MKEEAALAKNDVERRFGAVLRERGWAGETPMLLGVSGGSDSMSLFYLFCLTLGPSNVAVVHMDHGLRTTASRDREFVEKCCAEMGVRCVAERREVPRLALKGESEEAAGRRLRYELYERTRERLGCRLVALGHTRNDLAENALMNIARGCGLRGLAGMPERRGVYIRPLLGFYREELRDFLRSHGWGWVDDETNEMDIYRRNRVRHEVMPVLERVANPRVVEHLAALAGEALAWRDAQEAESRRLFREVLIPGGTWPALNLKKLRRLGDFQRVELFRWIGRELGLGSLSRGRTDELNRLAVTSGRWVFQWGSAVDAAAGGGTLRFHPAAEKRAAFAELKIGGSVRWGGWRVSISDDENAVDDFGFSCAIDSSRPVILKKNADALTFGDPFPIVGQPDIFQAERKQNEWEILAHSVKCTGVSRILFTPLAGVWRKNLWS